MKVEVHSRDGCPFCVKAKDYLDQHDIPYDEILHNDVNERQEFYDSLGLTEKRQRTVPQIIVVEKNGTENRIGGYTELVASDLVSRFQVSMDVDF